ncbi:telomerase reverse transcriptase-like isoform X2 [Phoenix dactylifera]|uniref:Telomerase reverse transcriptase n=1 Tax=Phoenix dactylifera TaxID=42345 RepID=A0A8B8ZNS4_PHODC|nr:telomerase reverse transcriptase-like isoform X2 [Phoenix dactylifera]
MARKRRRVPEALRRAYGDRARSLEETILSLLPHPPPLSPSQCRCRGQRCLGCGGSGYLLRRDDPPDYRNLLSRAVCVVPSGVPPPPVVYSDPRLPQRQIVANTMELIIDKPQEFTNVLCSNYDKQSCFSPTGEFLYTRAWDLLLTRIGNPLMAFLLQFSSIFIPIANKNHYQVSGTPLNRILQRPESLCTASMLTKNQQSLCLKNKSNLHSLGPKLKRRRDDLDEGPTMDFSSSVLQPNNSPGVDSLGSDCHGIVVAKHKRHAKGSQRTSRQTDLQCILGDQTAGMITDTNIFSTKIQHGSNTNPHFHSEDFIRQHYCNVICQTSALEQKKSACSLKNCTKSGKAIKTENLFSSHAKVMHHKQEVSSCSQNKCSAIDPNIADAFEKSSLHVFSSTSRKHRRLFRWQRHRKCKVSCSGENLLMGNNEGPSRMNLKQNSNANFNHQPVESAGPFIYDIASELCDAKDQELNSFPASVVMGDAEAIDNLNSHSVRCEEVYQGYSPSVENSHHLPRAMSEDKCEKGSHADELLSNYIGSFRNQHILNHHSDKIASQCCSCVMLRASPKVAVGTQIKRNYVFYNTFSSYSVFPRNGILTRLKPNNSGAISLMKHIFGFRNEHLNLVTCISCNGFSAIKPKCLYHLLLGSLKALIRNAQRCQHKKLLLKHCPVTTFGQHNKDENGLASEVGKGTFSSLKMFKEIYSRLQCPSSVMHHENSEQKERPCEHLPKVFDLKFDPIESYCRHQEVVSFVWAVARSIVPPFLLGNSSTWRSLRKNISKFISLHRFENFQLKQCIHGLKTSCYPFLSKVRDSHCCNNKAEFRFGNSESLWKEIRKPSDIMILHNNFFLRWIHWFFSYMVVPIIAANFYVTERESRKNDVFYYPKPVWRILTERSTNHLNDQNYSLLDPATFEHIMRGRSFGFSKVRYVPKGISVRPLANLRAPSKVRLRNHGSSLKLTAMEERAGMHCKQMSGRSRPVHYKSVNSALRELHAILRIIKVEHPQLIGSSVFDYNDVYQKVHQFLCKVKNRSTRMPEVFIVVADVLKAFDSIDLDMLIRIMRGVIRNDEYILRKQARVVCKKSSIRTLYDQVSSDFCTKENGCSNSETSIRLSSSNNIFIDQGTYKRIKKKEICSLLGEHLKRNVLQVGRNFYLQKVGISQGSLLSSLLCSFYYGHMERNVIFPYLEKAHRLLNGKYMVDEKLFHGIKPVKDDATFLGQSCTNDLGKECGMVIDKRHWRHNDLAANVCVAGANNENSSLLLDHLLLRFTDDILFISTSKEQASNFFYRLRRGFREYNCYMNDNKFGVNFDLGQNRHLVNRVYTGEDGISFLPWSGLLINCRTLEIQADYTRYCRTTISSTITVNACAKPMHHLKAKLCDHVRIKCHPILYDSNINSPAIVRLNAYQAFLLGAMKFHCYICSISDIINPSASYLLKILEWSFSYMYKFIKKRMYDMRLCFNIHPVLLLKKTETIWLGLSAYIRVLKKKQSRHKELLSLLRTRIATYGGWIRLHLI